MVYSVLIHRRPSTPNVNNASAGKQIRPHLQRHLLTDVSVTSLRCKPLIAKSIKRRQSPQLVIPVKQVELLDLYPISP